MASSIFFRSGGPSSSRKRRGLGPFGLGLALVLAGGRPVVAMDPPAGIEAPRLDRMPRVLGFAGAGERQVFALEAGRSCAGCRSAEAKAGCAHGDRPRLAVYRWVTEADGSACLETEAFYDLHPDIDRMVPGPGANLIVGRSGGELGMLIPHKGPDGWDVTANLPYLSADDRARLGLPSTPFQDFAVGPDGSIALAYGRNVAWLPRAGGRCAKGEVKWLLGGPPKAGESKQDGAADPAPGVLLAVDSAGLVFAAVPAAKSLFRIDPRSLRKEVAANWIKDGYQPVSIATGGRHVHIGLRAAEGAPADRVQTLVHCGEGQGCLLVVLPITGEVDRALGVTSEGDLVAYDPAIGAVKRIFTPMSMERDAEAAYAARGAASVRSAEAQVLKAALARLEQARTSGAASLELFAEEARREGKLRKAKGEPARDSGPAGRGAGAGAGAADEPAQMDAGLSLDEAIRLHSSTFGLAPKAGAGRPAGKPGWSPAAGAGAPAPRPKQGARASASVATGRPATSGAAGPSGWPVTRPFLLLEAVPTPATLTRTAGPDRPRGIRVLAPLPGDRTASAGARPAGAREPAAGKATVAPAGARPAVVPESKSPVPVTAAVPAGEAKTPAPGPAAADPAAATGQTKVLDGRPVHPPVGVPVLKAVAAARSADAWDRTGWGRLPRIPAPIGAQVAITREAHPFALGPGFEDWGEGWVRWIERETPGDRPDALALMGDDPGGPALEVDRRPVGLGWFALPPAAITRVVAWMLAHAGHANLEVHAWRRAGGREPARFPLGLYYEPDRERFVLELEDVSRKAARIDAEWDGKPVLAEALGRSGGLTGVQPGPDGRIEPAYGLAVVLGGGPCHLGGIQPAGATRGVRPD